MENPFSLIPVAWNGEELMSRPVDWDGDPNTNEMAVAITYEITCPSCGCMVHFDAELVDITCECGSSTSNPLFISMSDMDALSLEDPADGIQLDPDDPLDSVDPYKDPDNPLDGININELGIVLDYDE